MNYREFVIPKKNGKVRKIVAPDAELLSFQRFHLSSLVDYFNQLNPLPQAFHGFVPHRNCVTAARQHVGFKSTVILDLANFFDTVTRDMLPDINISEFFHRDGYCAQGFATSPMLCNIAIIPFISNLHSYLYNNLDRFALTIYADDIQISTDLESSQEISDLIIDTVLNLAVSHGFAINHSKTRILYAKYGYRRILGINVGDTAIRATRKTMRRIRAARHQNNYTSLGGLVTWSQCRLPRV